MVLYGVNWISTDVLYPIISVRRAARSGQTAAKWSVSYVVKVGANLRGSRGGGCFPRLLFGLLAASAVSPRTKRQLH